MTQQQNELARQWNALLEGAGAAIDWVDQVRGNSKQLNSEADSLVHQLRQLRNKSRDLMRAAQSPMTIGFFGESQAGKSYLISALGADQRGQFEANYGGQLVNFITHINPPGTGKEATGLVTRFTRNAQPSEDDAYPVEVRLFREIDLAKILSNSWFNDFDQHRVEYRLDEARIEQMLARFHGRDGGAIQRGVNADDVVSLWDYARASFAKPLRLLENGYWQHAMKLAPHLSPDERAQLFSVLWGELPEFTQMYAAVAASLGKLKNAETAYLPLSALATREGDELQYGRDSIMSVDVLLRQGSERDKNLAVRPVVDGKLGAPTELLISHLAVLTVELIFPLVETESEPRVSSVDLLDFPGYRGRYKARELSEISSEGNPVGQMLLRGKVAYLFENYTITQAMNGLVVCSYKQGEVSETAQVLERWVECTQGETAQSRSERACGLFWALTMFDMRLQAMLTHEGGSQIDEGWAGMLRGAMEERFGNLPFMKDWSGGVQFNNVYLVRKPGMDSSFVKKLGKGKEQIDPDKRQALERLGESFCDHPDIRRRIADPRLAWDAVMTENDGGMNRLAAGIKGIADLEFKLGRLRQQLHDELEGRGSALARLASYHQDIDGDDVEKKRKLGQQLAQALYASRRWIPILMQAMELSQEDLRELYLNGLHAQAPKPTAQDSQACDDAEEVNPFAFEDTAEHNPFAKPDTVTQAESGANSSIKLTLRTADHLYAEAVFQRWVAHLRDLPERKRLLDAMGVKREVAQILVDELITTANRVNLQAMIEGRLTARQDSSSKREHLVMRQVLRAQLGLNDFVAWLGFLNVEFEKRPVSIVNKHKLFARTTSLDSAGLPDLHEVPLDTNADYVGYWLTGLQDVVLHNAGHTAGSEINLEQNQALARILANVRQA